MNSHISARSWFSHCHWH